HSHRSTEWCALVSQAEIGRDSLAGLKIRFPSGSVGSIPTFGTRVLGARRGPGRAGPSRRSALFGCLAVSSVLAAAREEADAVTLVLEVLAASVREGLPAAVLAVVRSRRRLVRVRRVVHLRVVELRRLARAVHDE